MLESNGEQIFGLLFVISFVSMIAMWFITRTPSHKNKKP